LGIKKPLYKLLEEPVQEWERVFAEDTNAVGKKMFPIRKQPPPTEWKVLF
jgi:hypothetical protein